MERCWSLGSESSRRIGCRAERRTKPGFISTSKHVKEKICCLSSVQSVCLELLRSRCAFEAAVWPSWGAAWGWTGVQGQRLMEGKPWRSGLPVSVFFVPQWKIIAFKVPSDESWAYNVLRVAQSADGWRFFKVVCLCKNSRLEDPSRLGILISSLSAPGSSICTDLGQKMETVILGNSCKPGSPGGSRRTESCLILPPQWTRCVGRCPVTSLRLNWSVAHQRR